MAGILIFLFIYVLTQKYQHHSGHTPNPTPHRQPQTQHCPSTPLGGLHWLGHSWGQQGQPGGGMLLTATTLTMHQQQLLQAPSPQTAQTANTGSPRHSTAPAHPWEAYTGCDTAGDNRGSQGGHGD